LVVSNTSPLVYLAALGDFEFLRELFGQIAIPQAVHREIAVGGTNLPVARAVETWLSVADVTNMPEVERLRQTGLHSGEIEAIVTTVRVPSTDVRVTLPSGERPQPPRGDARSQPGVPAPFFNTHFRPERFPMDTVIFTEGTSLEEFQRDRPLEYRQLVESGKLAGVMPESAPRDVRFFAEVRLYGAHHRISADRFDHICDGVRLPLKESLES
jgi:hypothetical protein